MAEGGGRQRRYIDERLRLVRFRKELLRDYSR